MRKTVLYFLPFLFLGVYSSCRPKVIPYPSGVVFPLEKSAEMAYEGRIIDLIQKRDGKLYFSTSKGFVYCVDGLKREIIWKFKTQFPLAKPPYLGEENIFVYDRKNIVYCLDKEGKLQWKKKIEESITSEIRENRGNFFFGTREGSLFALSLSNGELLWRFKAGGTIRSNPVFYGSRIIFGCDNQNLYFLNRLGKLVDKREIGGKIEVFITLDNNLLFFGASDKYFYCFDVEEMKVKWKVKTGSIILSQAVYDEKRVYFVCWNSVLYSLNKNNGTIIWWQILPSRSFYRLELVEDKIVAASLSSTLVCFDRKTGAKQGVYEAGLEIRSNPLWLDPFLLINLYEQKEEEGKIVFLKKEIKAVLTPSKQSPLKFGEEVTFTVSATGFFNPRFEFYLKTGENKEIVQEFSDKNSWGWFPPEPGTYLIGARVEDEKEKTETKISYTVERVITVKPDLILYNGKIWTMVEENPWAEALAVARGRIVLVGKNSEVLNLKADKTVVIDMKENFALPGFIDTRVQMLKGGYGLLREEPGEDFELEKMDQETARNALLKALSEAAKMGITTVQDFSPPLALELYKDLLKKDRLTARILLSFPLSLGLEKVKELREKFMNLDDKFIRLGVVRGDLDGNLVEGKAALSAPYSDNPDSRGKLNFSPKELKAKMQEFHKEDFQLSFKASGDRAVTVALRGIEAILQGREESKARFWIEKVQFISSEDWEKFARLKVRVVGCPEEMIRIKDEAEKKLGLKRVRKMFPWKTLLDNKADLAFASDWPQESLNPFLNIYVSLTRETLDGDPPGGWLPWEKIDLDQALAAYTRTAARCLGEDKVKGTLEKNRLADIIVLSRNLYEISAIEMNQTEVMMTFLGGKLVYLKPGFRMEKFDPNVVRILNIIFLSMNLGKIPM